MMREYNLNNRHACLIAGWQEEDALQNITVFMLLLRP
jgi:hypothetical protein